MSLRTETFENSSRSLGSKRLSAGFYGTIATGFLLGSSRAAIMMFPSAEKACVAAHDRYMLAHRIMGEAYVNAPSWAEFVKHDLAAADGFVGKACMMSTHAYEKLQLLM